MTTRKTGEKILQTDEFWHDNKFDVKDNDCYDNEFENENELNVKSNN